MKTKIPKLIIAALLIVLLAGGGYLLYQSSTAPKTSSAATTAFSQVVDVKQGSVASSTSLVGQLEAVQSASLTFEKMSGSSKLLTLNIKAGAVVTASQVLATIDSASYRTSLDQAESDYESAVETLANLQSPATALELAEADLALAKAEYNLVSAQESLADLTGTNLADLQLTAANAKRALATADAQVVANQYDTTTENNIAKLRTTEDKAAAEYNRLAAETWDSNDYRDKTRINWNKAMDAHDARATAEINQQISIVNAQITALKAKQTAADAQKSLDIALAGGDTLAVAKAKLAVESAKVALTTAQESKADLVAGADATALATAQAAVDQKRLALIDARAAYSGTQLTAPFNGTILKVNSAVGNLVSSANTIATIADLKSLRVVASVDETTIKKISEGQNCNITFDALPGRTITGTVGDIPLQGTLQSSVMVYDVPIKLSGAENLPLLVGMTANVKVQSAAATNVLLVPTMALQKTATGHQVLLVTAANPLGVATVVEIGVADGSYTQITKGLSAGDKVLITTNVAPTATPFMQQRGPGAEGGPGFIQGGGVPGGGMGPGGGVRPGQ